MPHAIKRACIHAGDDAMDTSASAADVARAQIGIVDASGQPIDRRRWRVRDDALEFVAEADTEPETGCGSALRRRVQREPIHSRDFAGDAADRQAVGAIRRDIKIEDSVVLRLDSTVAGWPRGPARFPRARDRASTCARQFARRSQRRRRSRGSMTGELSQPELLQEAQIVFVEQTNIVHVPLQ